ncbi:MAG: hypothetical protein R2853_14650 [Thermomicrobiales bacterium]
MDDRHFDALTRALTAGDSRRRLLARLAMLPVLGGLPGIVDAGDAEAGGGRRKRRVKRHKHGKGRRRNRKRTKKCRSQPIAQTCSGACGTVLDNCQKSVDCGPCDCGSCPICQTCDTITGECIPNTVTAGDACGDGLICVDGQCVCDGTGCPTGCCEANTCYVDDATACGSAGGACTPCAGAEVCDAGTCCSPDGATPPSGAACCAGLIKCPTGVCQADCCAGVSCRTPGDECSGGVCAPPPTCGQFQADCTTGSQCCSGSCAVSGCLCSAATEACYVDRDCCGNPQPQRCVGFRCQPIAD